MSTVLDGREPYKTVLGFATLLGEDGRPMHKSWGNSIEFNEGADRIGVDVMRWMFVRQDPASNLLFGYRVADETRRKFHFKVWNVYNFFITYANLDGWNPKKMGWREQENLLDRWIISRLGETRRAVEEALEEFNAFRAASEIERFVDELSNWYIRRSRDRVGPWVGEGEDKESFYETCFQVLLVFSKMTAPFIPFISEVMYKNLSKEESVHLADWPAEELVVDSELNEEMDRVREIVESGHAKRKLKQVPIRQPLRTMRSKIPFEKPRESLIRLILDELNVKEWKAEKGNTVKSDFDWKIDKELEEEALAREIIRKVQNRRREMGVEILRKVDVRVESLPGKEELVERIRSRTGIRKISIGEFGVFTVDEAEK